MSLANGNAAELSLTWLFLYGPAIPAQLFVGIAGGPVPTEVHAAVAEDAWLSFDARGTPYFEPATSSLIIKGVNDHDAPEKDGPAYMRWINERCRPGHRDEGRLPPNVEGVVLRVTSAQLLAWQVYRSTFGHPSLKSSPRLVPVTVRCFQDGDLSNATNSFVAHTLVASNRSRAAGLQPVRMTQAYHFLALTLPCSKTYAGSLASLRPYVTERRIAMLLMSLFLLPFFATCYLPFALLKKPIPLLPARILEEAISMSWVLESYISPWLGSGHADL